MLVDVPKSTTTQAVPNSRCAARVFTTRSAPTSRGLSTSSGTPVRTPGPTTTCGTSGRRSQQQPQLAQQARHRGQRGDPGDLRRRTAPSRPRDGHLELVGGHPRVGAHPPVADQRRARPASSSGVGVEPERDLGVADVDAEQHGVSAPA